MYFTLFISGSLNYITEPLWFRLTAVIIPLAFIGVSIYVLIERIKEIMSGGRKMILVNTDYIPGKELEMLGIVTGSTIQDKACG